MEIPVGEPASPRSRPYCRSFAQSNLRIDQMNQHLVNLGLQVNDINLWPVEQIHEFCGQFQRCFCGDNSGELGIPFTQATPTYCAEKEKYKWL
jgi:hypothetical protein